MAQPESTKVHTFIDIDGAPVHAGIAYVTERRNVTTVTFDYDTAYQADPRAFSLSPDLPLTKTNHHTDGLPKAFSDSAPDRWGRNLIRKRHQAVALSEGRPTSISEVDYLLGVNDATRQGALRFALDERGPFVADDTPAGGVPRLIELPRLLAAADEVAQDPDDMAAIKVLLDAGTGTLGGARPKASIRDDGRLLIAKFGHPGDEWDVIAWEKTALDLAEAAGISTPIRQLTRVEGRHILLLERFDRDYTTTPAGQRLPYISAMTLLGTSDGASADYLEVAEELTAHGANVNADLAQLWRRIALSIVINNTDDHMRNHGFIHTIGGWTLAPAFDINPDPDPARVRASTVGFTGDPNSTLPQLLEVAGEFGLTPDTSELILAEVTAAAANWRDIATANGVPPREQVKFAPALDRHL